MLRDVMVVEGEAEVETEPGDAVAAPATVDTERERDGSWESFLFFVSVVVIEEEVRVEDVVLWLLDVIWTLVASESTVYAGPGLPVVAFTAVCVGERSLFFFWSMNLASGVGAAPVAAATVASEDEVTEIDVGDGGR